MKLCWKSISLERIILKRERILCGMGLYAKLLVNQRLKRPIIITYKYSTTSQPIKISLLAISISYCVRQTVLKLTEIISCGPTQTPIVIWVRTKWSNYTIDICNNRFVISIYNPNAFLRKVNEFKLDQSKT